MFSDDPIHGVGDGLKVREQRDAAFERGQFASGDGLETCVVECTRAVVRNVLHFFDGRKSYREDYYVRSESIRAQAIRQIVWFKRANTTP
jgi:hypothetical protein